MEQANINKINEELKQLKKELAEIKNSIGDDLKFAIRTELAWQSHDKGEFKSYSEEEFLKKLEEW